MQVYCWNVNGLRSCAKKGFLAWLEGANAHIVGLQEVRAREEQLDPEVACPQGWHTHFVSAERPGYSGVATYSRIKPDKITVELGIAEMDREGRTQILRFGPLTIVNCYFPNGNGKNRDLSRVPFKLNFYDALFQKLQPAMTSGERVIVMGDFNTAHREIDLARPQQNKKSSGFLQEERQEMDRWINAGWIDTFRHFEQGGGHYTWWSQRFGVRAKNIGWRIDYILASPGAMPFVRNASIDSEVQGSDHCPIRVSLDSQILEDNKAVTGRN
ncbi:MAG: exodeoxyribonuclease III [Myxococcota bacterium]